MSYDAHRDNFDFSPKPTYRISGSDWDIDLIARDDRDAIAEANRFMDTGEGEWQNGTLFVIATGRTLRVYRDREGTDPHRSSVGRRGA